MNLLLISLLAIASVALLPAETLGKKDINYDGLLKKKYELKKHGKVAIGGDAEREVLIRNVRGAKAQGTAGANGSSNSANELGKMRKNRKAHRNAASAAVVDNSTRPLLAEQDSADLLLTLKKSDDQQNNIPRGSKKSHQAKPKQRKDQLKAAGPSDEHDSQHSHVSAHNNRRTNANLKDNSKTLDSSNSNSSDKANEKIPSSCRYSKSAWTECDAKTNTKSRTLTLKKAEDGCMATRTIQKKCKKSCRYEKGSWSDCTNGRMARTDSLKPNGDSTCQQTRVVNKNCNAGKSKGNKERKNKDKGKLKAEYFNWYRMYTCTSSLI